MIIEIVLVILVITEAYIIWNLNKKTETLETWLESFSDSVYQIQSDLKEIDSRGHFEADDEVVAALGTDTVGDVTGETGTPVDVTAKLVIAGVRPGRQKLDD